MASRGVRRPLATKSYEEPRINGGKAESRFCITWPAGAVRCNSESETHSRHHYNSQSTSNDSLLAARRPSGQAEKTGKLESRRMDDSHKKMDQGDTLAGSDTKTYAYSYSSVVEETEKKTSHTQPPELLAMRLVISHHHTNPSILPPPVPTRHTLSRESAPHPSETTHAAEKLTL